MSRAQVSTAMQAGRLTKRLEHQAATFGMSSRAARIHKLAQEGAKDAVVASLRAADQQLTKLEAKAQAERRAAQIIERTTTATQRYQNEVKELRDLHSQGLLSQQQFTRAISQSAEQAQAADPAWQKYTATMRRGEQLTRDLASPFQKLEHEVAELDELLGAGAITHKTYNRAVTESARRLGVLDEPMDDLARSLGGLEAAQRHAADITRQAITPLERHARTTQQLRGHLDAGRISQQTYTRAVRAS
ncbi:MAG: hypothetical protein AAGL98_08245, partial [Planctomycetota bacterium]